VVSATDPPAVNSVFLTGEYIVNYKNVLIVKGACGSMHYATSRKIAGSSSEEVDFFFQFT
jgi:hypothetical protein